VIRSLGWAAVFDEERAALHRRVGQERGDRVLQLVVTLDMIERNKAAGREPFEKPDVGSADDVRAELRKVLELSDEELIRLAAIAEDATRHTAQAYPPPARN
jgi:hypothetical protein